MGQDNTWNMGRILSVSTGYWQACTVHAAVRLELFSLLGDEQVTAEELTNRMGAESRGVIALANALTAMGLLERHDGRYANSAAAKALLVKGSPDYIGYIIMHHHHLVDGWAQLDQAVRYGRPVKKRSYGEERERENFLLGMHNLAMAIAPSVTKICYLRGRRHLLDLGGGPGTYAIHFCQANPGLCATIFDRHTTREFAQKTVVKFGLSDRIDFMAGDFNLDDLGGPYDVAWLSHILHSNGPDECDRLIQKTVTALEPGGLIMIHGFFLNDSMDGPLFPALFSLNMLINNPHGRSYSEQEMTAMLTRAGVKEISRLPFQGPNDSAIICGRVGR